MRLGQSLQQELGLSTVLYMGYGCIETGSIWAWGTCNCNCTEVGKLVDGMGWGSIQPIYGVLWDYTGAILMNLEFFEDLSWTELEEVLEGGWEKRASSQMSKNVRRLKMGEGKMLVYLH